MEVHCFLTPLCRNLGTSFVAAFLRDGSITGVLIVFEMPRTLVCFVLLSKERGRSVRRLVLRTLRSMHVAAVLIDLCEQVSPFYYILLFE